MHGTSYATSPPPKKLQGDWRVVLVDLGTRPRDGCEGVHHADHLSQWVREGLDSCGVWLGP